MKAARDADFSRVEREHVAGKSLVNLWVEHCAIADKPVSLKHFYRRLALWRSAGKPDLWSRRSATQHKTAAAPISITSGLMFLDDSGVALQARQGNLCVRFRDGSERLFWPHEHVIKTIIVAASASVTTDAIRWLEAGRIGLLIAAKSGEGFSLFSTEATLNHGKNPLAMRRKQFTASAIKIARSIVALKIKSYRLDPTDEREALMTLSKASNLADVISIEASTSLIYWRARSRASRAEVGAFELAFRDKVPESWRTFRTRNNARKLKPVQVVRQTPRQDKVVFSTRSARSPMNAMLNYAYAVMLAQTVRAICGHGLDPVYGFLHTDKRGRVSFAYDVLELLRARIDDVLFEFARLRKFERADFAEFEGGIVRLSNRLAREIAARVLAAISFHEVERNVMTIAKMF